MTILARAFSIQMTRTKRALNGFQEEGKLTRTRVNRKRLHTKRDDRIVMTRCHTKY
jgi:hypothetical protein